MTHVLVFPSWYPVSPDDVRGVFFRDQAFALREYGHEVGVVAVNMSSLRSLGKRNEDNTPRSYEVDEGIPTYRRRVWALLPRIPYGNYWVWRGAARARLAAYVREQGWPDVIHAHSALYAGAVAVEWGKENAIPVVLTEHSTGFARGTYKRWQLKLSDKAAATASACIAVSPALGKVLDSKLPSSLGQWRWVPNVVADRFYDRDVRERGAHPIRFLNLGIMTEKKGHADLIEAFAARFGEDNSTVELWLAGDGPLRTSLMEKAARLGVASRVRFLGRVAPSDVPKLLEEIDIMVVSSHYETFGVVAAEALTAGVPVLATRCGGPECIVQEGDGLLVPPGDPQSLGEAMVKVAGSMADFDGHSIAQRAKARFSGQAVARQLTDIYDDVLECFR